MQVQVDRYTDAPAPPPRHPPGADRLGADQRPRLLPWSERIELDLAYLERASLRHDLHIVFETMIMVATGNGLYRGETGGWR